MYVAPFLKQNELLGDFQVELVWNFNQ